MKTKIKIKTLFGIMFFCYTAYGQNSEWIAPLNTNKRVNPFINDAKAAEKGKKIYEKLCMTCHGKLGKGDGPTGKALNPKPADHTSEKVQKQGDGAIYWKISTGRGVMPSFKNLLSKTERWQLTAYIRKLGEN
jgi:mono/diheme cytochrome c family protein